MKYCRPSVLLLTSVLAASALSGQDVTLYPETDTNSEPVATVPRDDPRLVEGSAVLDETLAGEGWYWGEFEGRFQGFVPDSKIGKDLLPVEGAYIYAEPESSSRILTTVSAEDIEQNRVEIVERGIWWTVAFTKPIPVFYREPVVSAEPVPEPPAAEPRDQVRAIEPAPAPPVPTPPPAPETPSIQPAPTAEPEPADTFVAGDLGTNIRGTLHRTKSRFFIIPAPYEFELLDPNGKRIAYVDFSEAILQEPVSAYLGRSVSVFGRWEKVEESRAIVIRARNLRPDLFN